MRIDVQPRGGGDRRGRIPKHAAAAKPHFDRGSVRPCGTSSQGPGWLALEPRSWATNYAIGDGDPAEPACGLGMDMECRHGSNGRWLGLHCPARLGCAGREHARRMRGRPAGRPDGRAGCGADGGRGQNAPSAGGAPRGFPARDRAVPACQRAVPDDRAPAPAPPAGHVASRRRGLAVAVNPCCGARTRRRRRRPSLRPDRAAAWGGSWAAEPPGDRGRP